MLIGKFNFTLVGRHVSGASYKKAYYVPRWYRVFWVHARPLCQASGMEILTLDTQSEADNFLNLLNNSAFLASLRDDGAYHIGAISHTPRTTTDWYWVASRKKTNFVLKFGSGQPDFDGGDDYCLNVYTPSWNQPNFGFNDVSCNRRAEVRFICEKDESNHFP